MLRVANICGHSFVENWLSDNSCIVDCGANHGDFAKDASRKWHCTIHGLEPDPRLFPRLPRLEKCEFHEVALAGTTGTRTLNLGQSYDSSFTYEESHDIERCEVTTISLPDLCNRNGIALIDLLKLDTEGAEVEVFASLEDDWIASRIIQLTVEFHEFLDPRDIPAIASILQRLQRLGFYCLPFSRTYGDILFVNKGFITISWPNRLAMLAMRYERGIGRVLARRLARRPT